ncbi:hypothetical protein NM208_g1467 [Fusarium decemcellulare]|uniref:Uncharacterized protein n=1 Tax=Fusarium decemcellulare TaxID=57161 RepID=A0ACC1SWK0_9HYPO|nr:hypothetical protein NM208_g1467 [Fusarium decemcellulare]
MHACAQEGEDSILKALLQAGAEVDAQGHLGQTPLCRLCKSPNPRISDENMTRTATTLLNNGADPNSRDHEGLTPIVYACKEECEGVKRLLISRGADTDVKDINGNTLSQILKIRKQDPTGLLLVSYYGNSDDPDNPDDSDDSDDFKELVYTVWKNWTQARLSGIGRRDWCDVIPLDEAVTEHVPSAIVDGVWLKVRLLEDSFDPSLYAVWHPQTVWGFPLHDCCWHILRANDPSMPEEAVVQSFFDLCRSQPIQLKLMDWGHDYGGLLRYELGPTVVCPGESTILDGKALIGKAYMSNPLDIPELQSILEEKDLEFPSSQPGLFFSPVVNKDPFAMFPDEVLVRILAHLHSKDVVSLLFSSRKFVNAGLPGPFWRSRFWAGMEGSHVFELFGEGWLAPRNWRRTYWHVKANNKNPALNNRRRIWDLACKLNTLIRIRMQLQDCKGVPIRLGEGDENAKPCRWNSHMGTVAPLSGYFRRGSRALYHREVLLKGRISRISISVTRFEGRTYICGLSFSHHDRIVHIGYHPKARSDVEVVFDDSLCCAYRIPSFELARDPRGIRGIRALSSDNCWSEWVGDHVDLPRTIITCDQLHERSTTPILTIVAGFDAIKMVSVNAKGARMASLRDTRLWYPEIPEPHLHLLGADHDKLQEFRGALPHSVCMFGGPNGLWLSHLKEVRVWGIDRSSLGEWGDNTCVMGIEFKYDKELNNAGERITGIDVMYQSPHFMAGFILSTSFGQRKEFPPHCKHYIDQDEGSDDFSENLRPPPETDIVGFYSTLEHNDIINEHDKVLTDLGVLCANKVQSA